MTVKLYTAFTLYLGSVSSKSFIGSKRWPKAHPFPGHHWRMCIVVTEAGQSHLLSSGESQGTAAHLPSRVPLVSQGWVCPCIGEIQDCWIKLTKSQKGISSITPETSPHPSLGALYCNVCTWNISEIICVYFKSLPKRTLDEIKTEKHAWVNLLQIQGLNITFLTWKNSSVYLTKTFH